MAQQNPHLRPAQNTILSGLETAAHYVSTQLSRWHSVHAHKYSDASLLKLQELDEQVEDLRDDRDLCGGILKPGDGTKILCILAQLNVMKDYMDEVDRMEKGWLWIDEADKIPKGDVNGKVEAVRETKVEKPQVEKTMVGKTVEVGKTHAVGEADTIKADAKADYRDPAIEGKYMIIDENGKEEESGAVSREKDIVMDGEFVYVDTDGEDGGMEAVNGGNDFGEQGLLTTLQKYLRVLNVR